LPRRKSLERRIHLPKTADSRRRVPALSTGACSNAR
jgi:ribosomal protein L39E